MSDIARVADALRAAGLPRLPPPVLLTRWVALLAGDQPGYLDAAYESGAHVSGSCYIFLAVTESDICYLSADHEDPSWGSDRGMFDRSVEWITPRTLSAWRRPMAQATEISVAGDVWQWLPERDGSTPACFHYTVTVGGDTVNLPLPSRDRVGLPPDPAPVLQRVRGAWRQRS